MAEQEHATDAEHVVDPEAEVTRLERGRNASKYDLTPKIAQHLDRHFMFPMLDFLEHHGIYPQKQILEARLQLLSKTAMIDYAMEIYQGLYEQPPSEEMVEQRASAVKKLRQLQEECAPFFERFQGEEGRKLIVKLQSEGKFNVENLSKEFGIDDAMVNSIYKYAKSQFECGYYAVAAECLYYYRTLSVSKDHEASAMWGKLASEILLQSWDVAMEDMTHLREEIENAPGAQLTARAWLIHWALLVFFNHPAGRDGLIELFFQERYLNVIQMLCPHLLRYLATAVITNKKKRGHMKDLVRVIEQERNNYRDPITEFVECLYIKFDFEGAQEKLRQCNDVLSYDFFLVACREDFIDNARLMIFESYCRIHSVIDIRGVAEKLNMNEENAEIWIVNLIREARLDARMDQAQKAVVMGSQTRSHYQVVKDKTKNLAYRTTLLVNPYQGQSREREDRRAGIGSALDGERRRNVPSSGRPSDKE